MGEIDPFVRSMLAEDRTSEALGLVVSAAHAGTATVEFMVRDEFANGHGIGHGGTTFSLADTAFACAANSLLPGSVTADASIVFFSPTRVGDTVVAHAAVRHATNRQSFVDVTVRVHDRVVAEFRARGVVVPNDITPPTTHQEGKES